MMDGEMGLLKLVHVISDLAFAFANSNFWGILYLYGIIQRSPETNTSPRLTGYELVTFAF